MSFTAVALWMVGPLRRGEEAGAMPSHQMEQLKADRCCPRICWQADESVPNGGARPHSAPTGAHPWLGVVKLTAAAVGMLVAPAWLVAVAVAK